MVTGDHLYADACRLAGRHGQDRLGAWWIQHPLQTEEIQILCNMVVLQLVLGGLGLANGKGQHPFPTGRHRSHGRFDRRSVEGLGLA